MSSGADPDLVLQFLQDAETLSYTELATSSLPKELRILDSKIFTALVGALEGRVNLKYLNKIRSTATFGKVARRFGSWTRPIGVR